MLLVVVHSFVHAGLVGSRGEQGGGQGVGGLKRVCIGGTRGVQGEGQSNCGVGDSGQWQE